MNSQLEELLRQLATICEQRAHIGMQHVFRDLMDYRMAIDQALADAHTHQKEPELVRAQLLNIAAMAIEAAQYQAK